MNADCSRMVLIVDDDDDVREAIAEILADNDLEPRVASNGKEALAVLSNLDAPPCLILLDIMMPVMDGIAFRSAQLADAKMRDIPVVVLSAHADPKKTAQDLRANAWLRKPVPLKTLLATIEQVCPPTP